MTEWFLSTPDVQQRSTSPQGLVRKLERNFTKVSIIRTKSDDHNLKESRFGLDIRKTFFAVRVVRHWHRFPKEVVDVASLEVFKFRLKWCL